MNFSYISALYNFFKILFAGVKADSCACNNIRIQNSTIIVVNDAKNANN